MNYLVNFYHFWNLPDKDPSTGKEIVWSDSYNKIMDLIFGQFLLFASILAGIVVSIVIIYALVKLNRAKTPEERNSSIKRIIFSLISLVGIVFVEVAIPAIISASFKAKAQLKKDLEPDLIGYNAPNYQLPYLSKSQIQTKTHTYTLAS